MATGCLSVAQHARHPGRSTRSRASGTTPATGRTTASTSPASASASSARARRRSSRSRMIAEQAEHLTVFQRTPNFSVPARNAPLDADDAARDEGELRRACRRAARETRAGFVIDVDPSVGARGRPTRSASASYEARWEQGGFGFLGAFTDIVLTIARPTTRPPEFVREQDPRRSCSDPEVAEAALAEGLPVRHQAALRRHRLLRDVQPRQRHARRPQGERRSRRSRRAGVARPSARVRARRHRVRHRLRRHDRARLLKIDIRGARRRPLKRRSGPTARARTSASTIAGFPNLFTDHRPGQPVGAQQHARVDRAARRLDRRLHRLHARARARRASRPPPRREDAWVRARQRGRRRARCSRWRTPGTSGANIPGKPRVFMPYVGGVARLPRELRRGRGARATRASRSRRPVAAD